MPCNGVSVATGRLAMNVTELIFQMEPEKLRDALAAAMVQHDPELQGAKPKKLPYKYDRGVTDFGFKLGHYLVGINRDGRVNVSLDTGAGADRKKVQALHDLIKNLMTGLAGLALQQQLARQVIAAGYQVNMIQQAPNGALVLEVEL